MPRERLSMRKIREVLRLHQTGLSNRAVARACSIGKETVREYLARAAEAGLGWPLPDALTEDDLERKLFPHEIRLGGKQREPDWSEIHNELRKKGVTRKLLWMEYAEGQTDVYRYTQFCERYTRWAKTLHPTMRMTHKAGEKLFVDYAGLMMFYQDRTTGERHPAPVFVATLGASSATYCEAQPSQAFRAGSAAMSTPSNTSAACRRSSSRTTPRPALSRPAFTSPTSIRPTRTWPSITGPLCCRPGCGIRGTRLKSRPECKWWSAG